MNNGNVSPHLNMKSVIAGKMAVNLIMKFIVHSLSVLKTVINEG